MSLLPTTPNLAADTRLARANLQVVKPETGEPPIPLRFNPAEITIRKTSNFAEVGIPGLDSPIIQWVRGGLEILSFDALVDTTDSGDSVQDVYVNRIRALLDFNSNLHAPPLVRFEWGPRPFVGVLDGLSTTYTLFNPQGVPLRAKLSITLKEYRPAQRQAAKPKNSPDVEKRYIMRRGDSLRSVAYSAYGDPALWRILASANGLENDNPLPGTPLRIPRLR